MEVVVYVDKEEIAKAPELIVELLYVMDKAKEKGIEIVAKFRLKRTEVVVVE